MPSRPLAPASAGTPPSPPAGAGAGQGPAVDALSLRLFKFMDDNGDRALSHAEFLGLAPDKAPPGALDALDKLFDRLDRDDNGSVSLRELHGLIARVDADGDGHVSAGEAHSNPITLIGLRALHSGPEFG